MHHKGISISIGIGEMLSLLITLLIIILIIKFVFTDIIKIKFEKEDYVESGRVVNLVNSIINSDELSSLYEDGKPKKGVINKTKLYFFDGKNIPLECCDYYDYDYSINIFSKSEGKTYQVGYSKKDLNDLINIGKKCKAEFDSKNFKMYEFPVVLEDIDKKYDASLYLGLTKTPISFISSELSVGCMKSSYEKILPIYGFNKNNFRITQMGDIYEICVVTYKNIQMCKKIKCTKNIVTQFISSGCQDTDNSCTTGCSYVFDKDCKKNTCSYFKIKSNLNEVLLCFGEEERELEHC